VPGAALSNACIAHACCGCDELKNLAGGRPGAENGPDANRMERWAVVLGNNATAEDHDIVQSRLSQFLTDLGEQMGVGARKRREAQKSGILIPDRIHDLLGSTPQAGVDDLVSRISQGSCNHFGASVVTVEPRFGHHDAERLVHDSSTNRFPINSTLQSASCLRFLRASNKGGLG
jgi:hypothetical protein